MGPSGTSEDPDNYGHWRELSLKVVRADILPCDTYCVLCAYPICYCVIDTRLLRQVLFNPYFLDEQTSFQKFRLLLSKEESLL